MKPLSLWWLPLLCISMATHATGRKPEYKCHFQLVGGEQLVRYMPSDAVNGRSLAKQMTGQTIFAKDGVTKKYVYKVFECVRAEQNFQAEQGRALDARTLN